MNKKSANSRSSQVTAIYDSPRLYELGLMPPMRARGNMEAPWKHQESEVESQSRLTKRSILGFVRNAFTYQPGDLAVNFVRLALLLFATLLLTSEPVVAQDRSTGGIKGKVRVETGKPEGVTIVVRQGEREVSRHVTDKNGAFAIQRLPPGFYGLTFRKPGLSVGTVENLEVKAGKTRSMGDRLILTIDEGSIAFVRGSVFNQEGRSVPGVRVELAKIQEDGAAKKIDSRVTNETGSFVFRLEPDAAKYRVTAKPNGLEPIARDVTVEGAAVYRVALSFPPLPKQPAP